jgi:TRAP-type C4-dicarboxylate transport system substrate-binding protein
MKVPGRRLAARITAAAVLACGPITPLYAQTFLSAASAFPKGHPFSAKFERFVDVVNERSKGTLKLDYKGGAPAIGSPFTLGQRAQKGVFDIITITGAYYDSIVPEGLAMTLTEIPIQEQRRNGAYELFNRAHQDRGLYYLGKTLEYVPFQLYLRKPIDKADLKGMRLRVAPHHQPLFTTLGAATVRSDLSEIYTYMENGTIDGFAWPLQGFLPDWYRVTKYRMEPGFYDADMQIVLNLNAWKKLSPEHQKLLNDVMIEFESTNRSEYAALNEAARKAQQQGGLEEAALPPGEAAKWLNAAKESAWKAVVERSPQYGPNLKNLVTKP